MEITVDRIVSDQGSIVVFEGLNEDSLRVSFGADHRPAQAIADALASGEEPVCFVEDWQILGGYEA
jgi:hypothetical protein